MNRAPQPDAGFLIGSSRFSAPPLKAGLYLVATPIGHLKDITLRALETLAAADVVFCEDTRVTAKLLARYGLRKELKPYHDHNAAKVRPQILHRVAAGASVALTSDAGTPLVSDPGFRLVQEAIGRNLAGRHDPGRLGAARRARLVGPADRPVPVCRVSSIEDRRTPPAARRAQVRPGDPHLLRNSRGASPTRWPPSKRCSGRARCASPAS